MELAITIIFGTLRRAFVITPTGKIIVFTAHRAKILLLVFAHRAKLKLYKGLSRICPEFSAPVFFGKSLSNLCQVQV
jgi:hypothetical protein